ncbi:SCO2522 family protein [Nocardia brasiliensis]
MGYSEHGERARIEQVPLSHLSLEVGRFSVHQIAHDMDQVSRRIRGIAPLVEAFIAVARAEFGSRVRVSTCYFLDDYTAPNADPRDILGKLLTAADETGVQIDYLAREAGCATVIPGDDGGPSGAPISLAELVAASIVAEPDVSSSTGRRPPTAESGWLCNGRRPSDGEQPQHTWMLPFRPAEEFGRSEHSIFLDVQLWSERTESVNGRNETHRRWSAPMLAAVWQLLRLGVLRYHGAAVVRPQVVAPEAQWPSRWQELPAVIQLAHDAPPFAAYRSMSIVPKHRAALAHSTQLILDHLDVDRAVIDQLIARGAAEEVPVTVSRRISDRVSHLLWDGT